LSKKSFAIVFFHSSIGLREADPALELVAIRASSDFLAVSASIVRFSFVFISYSFIIIFLIYLSRKKARKNWTDPKACPVAVKSG